MSMTRPATIESKSQQQVKTEVIPQKETIKKPEVLQTKEEVKIEPPKQKQTLTTKYKPGVERWRPLVEKYDWPVNTALKIMSCESGGNPNALSRTNDRGLMQINHIWKGKYDLNTFEDFFNPEKNVYAGYRIYKNRGNFSAWTCSRKI